MSVYPYCALCWVRGKSVVATTVDHITPFTDKHDARRLDWDNLQSLCVRCHMGDKAMIQAQGTQRDIKRRWVAYMRRLMTCDENALRELPECLAQAIMDVTTLQYDIDTTFRMGWHDTDGGNR